MSGSAKKRVVVTGVGALSPLGHDWASVRSRLQEGRTAIRVIDEWKDYDGLNTQLSKVGIWGSPMVPLQAHLLPLVTLAG